MLDKKEWDARIDAFIESENRKAGAVFPVHRIYCQDDSDRSGGGIYNETVTADVIGRFARALGDSNPLYTNPLYARGSAWKGIIAPPLIECCICSTFIMGKMPRLRGLQVFDAGTKWERFAPIRPGDFFTAGTTYLGIEEVGKKKDGGSRLLLRKHAIDMYNQENAHVSRLTTRSMIRCAPPREPSSDGLPAGNGALSAEKSGQPATGGALSAEDGRLPAGVGQGKPPVQAVREAGRPGGCDGGGIRPGPGRPRYTEAELDAVYANLQAQFAGAFRRGARSRFWEDVEVGEELPAQVVGPYDESDGQSLMAAIGVSNAFATKWGKMEANRENRSGTDVEKVGAEKEGQSQARPQNRRPQKAIIDSETGARRLPLDRHMSDAVARAQGLPRAIVSGIHSQALIGKAVGDWMGDEGFLRSLDCQCKKPLYFGDLSTQRGRVAGKYEKDGRFFAVLEMEAARQDGVIHTRAEALVELPSRDRPSCPDAGRKERIADEKSPSRISRRDVARSAPE